MLPCRNIIAYTTGTVFWVDRPKDWEFDRMVNDLGASAIRFEVSPDNYPTDSNLYAIAVHGYSDGVSPDHGTASDWAALKSTLGTKRLWMTETTGDTSTVNATSRLQTAKTLHAAINSGKVSL